LAKADPQVPLLEGIPTDSIPAFPGAWGGGMFTVGGRGGRTIEVTNLNDSGPGSLRAACEAEGPRTVVFRVGGKIQLETKLHITQPNITIAGQTAPGDGICLGGESTSIDAPQVIIRYLRFRRGVPEGGQGDDSLGGDPPGDVIVDHCSASWGMDENFSIYRYMNVDPDGVRRRRQIRNVTVQWTLSSEALNANNHAFGGTWGGQDSTFHHNMFANNTGRNPSIGASGPFDYRNNVIFNWRHRTMDGGSGSSRINVINNYYKPGPVTNAGELQYRIARAEIRNNAVGRWFVQGNVVEGHPEVTENNWNGGVQVDDEERRAEWLAAAWVGEPFAGWPIEQHTAEEAYALVLDNVGATLPVRDAIDARVIESVRTGRPKVGNGIINDPAEVGGYPEYKGGTAPADADHDGMPDAWEKEHGLDAADAGDGAADADGDGYTNLEEYLNKTDPKRAIDYLNPDNNISSLM
jgi:pectate lyase